MKKLYFLFLTTVLISLCYYVDAQNNATNTSENGRIGLAIHLLQQVDKISEATSNMLVNKMNQIVTQHGFARDTYFDRFIFTANIVPLTKDYLSTAPPMTAYTLEITFYIGDGSMGTLFSSKSITVKGVGTNETKAYIEAIKTINPSNPVFESLLEEGKSKIVNYYNLKCDAILKQAHMMAQTNRLEEAICLLSGIPDVCMDCYEKCMKAVEPIYQQYIDRDCQMKLAEATHIWNANQTVAAANAAGKLLSTIEPRAACFNNVKDLADRISKRVYEIDQREWAYTLRSQEQLSEMIQAYRDIGVAWATNQPRTIQIDRTNNIIKNWINVN